MNIDRFASWFAGAAAELRRVSPGAATDAIYAKLIEVDERLGVEVGHGAHVRELIVSAGGRVELFELVEEIVRRMQAPGWAVLALKPPRGFDFEFEADGVHVNVRDLYFEPLEAHLRPHDLAVQLLVPRASLRSVRQACWEIVETGLGELKTADVSHVEVAELPTDTSELLSIHELPQFVSWFRSKHPLPRA